MIEDLKTCARCRTPKLTSAFGRDRSRKDGMSHTCRQCHSDHYAGIGRQKRQTPEVRRKTLDSSLRRRYGISVDRYEAMMADQQGMCAICARPGLLVVDHCHSTGDARGLLCHSCNLGLGHFGDSVVALRAAATYLEVM